MTVQKPVHKIPEPPATGSCELVRQLWCLQTCLHPKASHGTLSTRETPRLEGPWWSHLPWKSLSWFVSWSRGRNLKGRDLRANFRAGHTIPMAGPLWLFSFLHTEMWDCRFLLVIAQWRSLTLGLSPSPHPTLCLTLTPLIMVEGCLFSPRAPRGAAQLIG